MRLRFTYSTHGLRFFERELIFRHQRAERTLGSRKESERALRSNGVCYGVGCTLATGVATGATVGTRPAGDDAVPVSGATVPCSTGFNFVFASLAAFCAAALAGIGAGALAGADVFINSRRTAESGAPRWA